MRPRVGSRGSELVGEVSSAASRGFNEAPSWFSGKSLRYARLRSSAGGFNEAPSWFSGKYPDPCWDPDAKSMLQ